MKKYVVGKSALATAKDVEPRQPVMQEKKSKEESKALYGIQEAAPAATRTEPRDVRTRKITKATDRSFESAKNNQSLDNSYQLPQKGSGGGRRAATKEQQPMSNKERRNLTKNIVYGAATTTLSKSEIRKNSTGSEPIANDSIENNKQPVAKIIRMKKYTN